MAMIAPESCYCNNRNPGFSGNLARSWPGRVSLHNQTGLPPPAPAQLPADTSDRLLDEIIGQLRNGQDTIRLRQIDLADILHRCPP